MRRARRDLELPADQQPVQRLRPHADPPRDHPLSPCAGSWSRTAARSRAASSARSTAWASSRSRCTPTPTARRPTCDARDRRGAASARRPARGYRDVEQLARRSRASTGADARPPGLRLPLRERRRSPPRSSTPASRSSAPRPTRSAASAPRTRPARAAADAGVPLLPGTRAVRRRRRRGGRGRAIGRLPAAGEERRRRRRDRHARVRRPRRARRRRVDAGDAAERARRSATPRCSSSGSSRDARHVEVQVFGDGDGTVVTLGERDCSTQRRRQKVIEEAPAPGLDDATARRARSTPHARLLEPMRYRSAGTVEFVVDVDTGDVPLPRGEHAAAGRARRHRGGHRHRPRRVDGAARRRRHRVPRRRRYAHDAARPRDRGAASTPRTRRGTSCRARASSPRRRWPRRRPRRHVGARPAPRSRRTTTRCSPRSWCTRRRAPTRVDGVARRARRRRASRGIETNRDLLASFVDGRRVRRRHGRRPPTLERAPRTAPRTVDVLAPGSHHGAGPPRARRALARRRAAERADGRPVVPARQPHPRQPGGRAGPRVHRGRARRCASTRRASVCLTGAAMAATLRRRRRAVVDAGRRRAGAARLAVGALDGPGLRTYLLVRGGFDVPARTRQRRRRSRSAASAATAAARCAPATCCTSAPATPPTTPPRRSGRPCAGPDAHARRGSSRSSTARTPRPTSSPTPTSTRSTPPTGRCTTTRRAPACGWSARRPEWARADGGEAGLHPSNIHDTPYTVGAVDFTGDMPIVLGPDGPSLGGFVCPVTVISDDRWKLGQLAPGDRVRFVPVDRDEARGRSRRRGSRARRATRASPTRRPRRRCSRPAPRRRRPQVTYRAQGDRAVLVEYGPMILDFDLRLRAHALGDVVATTPTFAASSSVTPGIRSLQVQFDPVDAHARRRCSTLLRARRGRAPAARRRRGRRAAPCTSRSRGTTRDARGDRALHARRCATTRRGARGTSSSSAASTGSTSVDDVHRIVFDAEYLVLGLGDVYLGAPVAVPVDPRHRLVTTKYNPARTWTPGERGRHRRRVPVHLRHGGPRRVPVRRAHGAGVEHLRAGHGTRPPEEPWLLRCFDRIRWHPVAPTSCSSSGPMRMGAARPAHRRRSLLAAEHRAFLARHAPTSPRSHTRRERRVRRERARWEASGEFTAATTCSRAPSPRANAARRPARGRVRRRSSAARQRGAAAGGGRRPIAPPTTRSPRWKP